MKLTLSTLILVIALLVNINTNAYSQTPPCFPEYQGIYYQMDTLINCPPYNSNMPLDVFIGYLALDSLSKYASLDDYNTFINRQSYNDTLRSMMRYIYKTVDYDPSIFLNFMYHRRYNCKPIDEYYYGLIGNILQKSPNPILDASLIGSFLVAQVYVDSIDYYIDTLARWAKTTRTVKATINQLIKGSLPIFNIPAIIEPTIQFTYAKEWFLKPYQDSTDLAFEMEQHKSYIVFLEYRFLCRDSSNVYFTLYPIRCTNSRTACIYPIENDNVIDTYNELGFGTMVNLNIFYAGLTNRINTIKNYTP